MTTVNVHYHSARTTARPTIFTLLVLVALGAIVVTTVPEAEARFVGPINGYYAMDASESGGPTYAFTSIAGTGTALPRNDDGATRVPLGFSFTIFGETFTSVYVNTNGILTFAAPYSTFTPNPLTHVPSSVGPAIAAYWTDLDARFSPGQVWSAAGTAPNRVFIAEWDRVGEYNNNRAPTTSSTFQVKIFEGTNIVEVHYKDANTIRGTASPSSSWPILGIKGRLSTATLTFLDMATTQTLLPDGHVVRYTPYDPRVPETTATPSGTPGSNGWWHSDVTVTLSATDTDEVVSTHYRLNGGANQLYGGPIVVAGEGVHTLQYWSVDVAGNVEPAKTLNVRIDATPPTLTLASITPAPAANGFRAAPATVSWSCTDATSGVAVAPTDVTFTQDGADQIASASCTDAAGNTAVATQSVDVDAIAPTTTHALAGTTGNAGWWRSAVTVTLSATDDHGDTTTYYTVNSGATQTYAGPFAVSDDGAPISVAYWSTDEVGNTEALQSVPLMIDTTPPTLTVASIAPSPAANGFRAAPVTVSWSCTDATSGVAVPPTDVTLTQDGAGQIASASCTDAAGNTAVETQSVDVDVIAPTTTHALAGTIGNGGWWRSAVTVSLSATDNHGATTTYYTVNNGATQTYTGPFAVSGDGSGIVVAYWSEDEVGNTETPVTAALAIDTTPPTLTLASITPAPAPNGFRAAPATVSWSCTDATSGVASAPTDVTLAQDGADQIASATCTDAAGNTAVATQSVDVDAIAPTTTHALAGTTGNAGWWRSAVTVTLSATDNHGDTTTYYSVNGGATQTYAGPFSVSGDGGAIGVSYWSVDEVGNPEDLTIFSLAIDATVPVFAAAPDVTEEAEDATGAIVSYSAPAASDATSGAGAVACAPASGERFPLGETLVTCDVEDAAGNSAQTTFVVRVVDTTPPTLTLPANIAVAADSASGRVVTYATSALDAVSGELPVTCSPTSGSMFAPGTTVVTCEATDAAGNTATGSFTVVVTFDWSGFLPPVKEGAVFKGRVVAVKFELAGDAAGVTDLAATLWIAPVVDGAVGSESAAASASSASTGNAFRWSSDGQYVFQWDTRGLAAGTWQIRADFGDGVARTVRVTLR